ncbi:MAG: hypothetical protein ACE14L_08795 [Terriglobales bacterium]
MSVYKRSYTPYTGPRTPAWSRFLVLTRYGLADAWQSRITNVLFVGCLLPFVMALVMIYTMNSETVRLLLGMRGSQGPPIDNRFFLAVFQVQCWLALALAAWTGPRLISADLANNALPIILSRPLDRAQYVAGKLLVLFTLLSAVTWLPCLVLFAFQAQLTTTPSWAMQNRFLASGMVLGALLWIAVLSLLALALASWVKWRVVATGLVFGALFVPAGIGEICNAILRTNWGSLLNVPYMVTVIWEHLFHVTTLFRRRGYIPPEFALAMLIVIGSASLLALHTRIRAREVVRG